MIVVVFVFQVCGMKELQCYGGLNRSFREKPARLHSGQQDQRPDENCWEAGL